MIEIGWGAKNADRVAFCKVKKSITDYPKVLESMTANQAGYWALMKCKEEKWHISDYVCCFSNLEMDM